MHILINLLYDLVLFDKKLLIVYYVEFNAIEYIWNLRNIENIFFHIVKVHV